MSVKPLALQLCAFSNYLTDQLAERFELVRWFELPPAAQDAWLNAHAANAKVVVTGGHIGCSNELIGSLPSLGLVAINGVGFDKVDLDYARARGVHVSNTPDVLTEDVADLAVGLVIGLLRALPAADRYVREGRWPGGDMPLARKVTGRRFGIVGLGRIGSAVARRLEAFGPVAYTDIVCKPTEYRFHESLYELAENVDVLILASAANAQTRHLIDETVLRSLGTGGFLINVARGSLVDEVALAKALEDGTIAGAALDVFENEPNVPSALRDSGLVVLSPHIASATVETRTAMADLVLANLDAFIGGTQLPSALV